MAKNFLLIFILIFVFKSFCFSQNEQLKLTSPVNVSPQAAAFSKFGVIPVSLNSGVPNISIPIYTIVTGDINFPIQLSYNASGIKVEEMASMVGLGWNLSYTGNITRQVRGLPDESTYGYYNTGGQVENYINNQLTPSELEIFKTNLRTGYIDGEKDIYYFSLPGSTSGKFFLDSNDIYTTIPRSNIKIENVNSTNATTGFWRITNDLGVQYIFNKIEYTATQSFSSTDGLPSTTTTTEGISAWYIGEITDARGNRVNFNYTGYQTSFRAKASETQRIVMSANYPAQDSRGVVDNYNQISGPKIESIQWREGKIMFAYSGSTRLDIAGNDKALSELSISDNNNTLIKKYRFSTSYFFNPPNTSSYDTALAYRLKLDSLTEISSRGKTNPPYIFQYNPLLMDHRRSNSQDRWGYFNGKNNTDFVTYFRLVNGNLIKFGANKDIDTTYTQANLLQKIYYPTGGNSSFEFEANRNKVYKPNIFFTYPAEPFVGTIGNNSGGDPYQYLHVFSEPFTVSPAEATYQNTAAIKAKIIKYAENPNNIFCNMTVAIISSSGVQYINDGDIVYLAAGNYTLQTSIETEFAHIPFASIDARLFMGTLNQPGYYDELFGGVRVKKIITSNGTNITGIKKFRYNKFGTNYSSGTIGFASPEFDTYYETINPCSGCQQAGYFVYASSHHYPFMQNNQGGYVSYANVEVQDEDGAGNNNGKTEYSFISFDDFSDFVDPNFPFPHATTYEWTRGLLSKEKNYRGNPDNSFTLIKEKISRYTFLNEMNDTTRRVITGITGACDGIYTIPMSNQEKNWWLKIAKCITVSEQYYQKSDTTILYDPDGSANSISTVNEYDYHKYPFLMKWLKVKDSKGNSVKTNFRYPYDYTPGGFIAQMLQKNMFAVPIEEYTEKINTANESSVISGVITSYKTNSLLKDKVYKINTSLPIPRNSFSTSFMNGNEFYPGSNYEPLFLYNKYDTNRNIIEQQKKDDALMTYIWDYSFNYPVAEVRDADSASIAYTSFEADGKGGWVFTGTPVTATTSITGKKQYNLSTGNINKFNLLASKTYIVSYWSKNGAQNVNGSTATMGRSVNGWTHFEHKVVPVYGVLTVSGSGTIDELRLHPLGSLMTTYTYDPQIGRTSVCDANNRITYYKYDDFGRLILVIDQDNNIVKKICYNYNGQPQDCITCTNYAPNWQNTSSALRCQLDSCGRNGYQQQEQKDVNPCSPTYNLTQWVNAGYNPAYCSPESCVTINSWNYTPDQDLVAVYYNINTGHTYTFNIPLGRQQPLGNIAQGTYDLTISRPFGEIEGVFQSGCGNTISGSTPVVFYNINVSSTRCNSITVENPYHP